jgi:hypothetical protein
LTRLKLKSEWLLVVCLCFLFRCHAESIVFVHLGDNVLPCIFTTMQQARYLNCDSDIYLLTDSRAYNAFSINHMDRLIEERIHLINMEWVPTTEEHLTFRAINKIDVSLFNGFWSYALERFFYLFDFIKHRDLKNVVHLESDSMLYVDLKELLSLFEKSGTQIAAPFQSTVGCIPCFVFIKDTHSFTPLIEHILSEIKAYAGPRAHIDVNDMQTLASFYWKCGASHMTPLPTLMAEYSQYHSKRKSNFEPDNVTPLDFLSMNAPLFPGYLFDAAALGVFANGNDRRYFPKNGPGIIHYRSIFDPGHFSFYWGKDEKNRDVPYLSFKGKNYRIVNMHFHSKMPEGYTSYGKTRTEFPMMSHP